MHLSSLKLKTLLFSSFAPKTTCTSIVKVLVVVGQEVSLKSNSQYYEDIKTLSLEAQNSQFYEDLET